jgi:SDR family mycofactocin-dependent oxidoreductase
MADTGREVHQGEWSGKVAFITGVARGQGRSHALEFARRGADIGGLDICHPIATVPYAMAELSDLKQTAQEIESLGGRALLEVADVRDPAAVQGVVARVIHAFGRIDVVLTNAGVFSVGDPLTLSPASWQDVLDVNLTGVWNTVQACLPAMVESGNGGSIVMTSSIGGVQGLLQCPHYVASKHGVIGLMRSLANELGQYRIRVNAVCPTNVNTPMIQNPANYRTFRPDLEDPRREDIIDVASSTHILDVPWVEPEDVTAAAVWLASDAARYLTGVALPVDAGLLEKVQN